MQAAVVTEFGGPEVIVATEVPDPVAGPGEVVIEVEAAGVLWLETILREGVDSEVWGTSPPYVPGSTVAGSVIEAGQGVEASWLGRRVVADIGGGGYAERASAPAGALVEIPAGLGAESAVALVHDGATALSIFETAGVTSEDRVLVVGASGGLGITSVQLAIDRGARVVAAARDQEKLARIAELGADAVIDSEEENWVDAARAALGGDGATLILDNVGGAVGEAAFGAIARGGEFSAHGAPSGSFADIDPAAAARLGVTLRDIGDVQHPLPKRLRLVTEVLNLAAAGRLAPVIGQTFPVSGAADAHRAIAARSVYGRTLIRT